MEPADALGWTMRNRNLRYWLDIFIMTGASEGKDGSVTPSQTQAKVAELATRSGSRAGPSTDPSGPRRERGVQAIATHQSAVLDLMHHGVVVTDAEGLVTYMNPRAEQIAGRSAATACGRPITEILCAENDAICPASLESSVLGCQRTIELVGDGPGTRTVELRVEALPRNYGEGAGYLYELRDVSESLRRTQQLMHDATHDPLTGLANRRALLERLEQLLQWAPEPGEPESILAVLDLDGFKAVNDDCGHLSGDEMLRELAALLQSRTRKADTAARLGGDEFVVLLSGCGMAAAHALMEEIRRAIAAYCYRVDGVGYWVTASIGLAGIDADVGDAQAVLRRADEACYCAKKQGGDRIVIYGQDALSESVAVLHARADLDIAQRLAQERNYLLYSQPIYRADSASAVPQRCEILLRIRDRKGGVITPDQFLPVAHRHGLEIGLDQWVVANTAAAWAARHAAGDNTPLECFVNLSRASIEAAAATADYVAGVLDKWQIPPGVLCLELKERDVLDCRQDASHLIRQLHQRGVHFALDAVGEGLYSLGYLKNLPVDYIKVSAEAILQTEGDAFYGAVLDALANVSRSLGIALVGVGAESEHILDRFGAYQMAYLQGHALSLPAPFPMDAARRQGMPGMEPH